MFLSTTLSMHLHFASGYYSKDNEKAECTNQTLEQYFYIL